MNYLELQQSLDEESAEDLIVVLEEAGIPFRRSLGNPSFDVSTLGSAGGSGNAKIIISVPKDQFHKAREAMEADCLTKQLPEDHFLFQSSEDELQEIVVNEFDWSAFDVAHAKRLLNERGVELQNPEEFKAAKIELLEKGKPASGKLLFFGWLFCLTGGLIGIGIGWSLYSMKEKTPEGEFHTYNDRAQETGKKMMTTGIIVLVVSLGEALRAHF